MNGIHELERRLKRTFPDAVLEMSQPARPTGYWFLDVVYQGLYLIVQWRRGRPFGLASGNVEAGYGEKPDEVYDDIDDAESRIVALLHSGTTTQPSAERTLRELRTERNLTQVELARRLKVEQPAISRLEHRASHLQLNTLREVVQAMRGRLIIQVAFEDGVVRKLRLEDEPEPLQT